MDRSRLISRREIGELLNVTEEHVGVLDDRGKLPCASITLDLGVNRGKQPKFYDRETILHWIYAKERKKFGATGQVTFQQIFAGNFESMYMRRRYEMKRMRARLSRPKTQIIKIKGEVG
jgi:hypothetical protein